MALQEDKRQPAVSVVMATCNGAPFLERQLDSIAAQSVLPDELVVGDDLSTDTTREIILDFAARNPRIDVRLTENPHRLGSTANFGVTAGRARGEIVVFADQDDEWLPHRIARLTAALEDDPEASHAFSDGLLIDDKGRPIGGSLFSALDFSIRERKLFSAGKGLHVLIRRNVVTGATLAVRKRALDALLPFETGWIHDYYIALALATLGHGVLVEEPLIRYRLHAGQQVSVARPSLAAALAVARRQDRAQCLAEAEKFEAMGNRLIALGVPPDHEALALLRAKADFNRVRARMRERSRAAPLLVTRALLRGSYRRYSLGWKQVVVDLLSAAVA